MRVGTSCPTSAQDVLDILACWSPIARWCVGHTPAFAAHIHRLIQRFALDLLPTKVSCRIGQDPMIRGLGEQATDTPLEEGMQPICAYLRPFPPTSPSRHVLLTPEVWARSLCQPGPHCAFLMPPTPWPAAQKTA